MSSDNITIRVKNLSKCYFIYDKPQDRLKQTVIPRIQRLVKRQPRKYYHEFWALRDVSFEVKRGETLGIIGRNGSGKSTLLQIICGTLTPNSGTVESQGRIAALLELGSGFNPEFTGRENVYMNGAIMGLSSREIEASIPLIEQFAEIGDFFDQPVKMYSSGMFVRLAFACAININPDILLIDEALAVGDMQFQLKCIERLKSLRKLNKTIIFVSHDIYAVRNFCHKAIWMMDGRIHQYGNVQNIIECYIDYMKIGLDKEQPQIPNKTRNDILTIGKTYFVNEIGKQKKDFLYDEPIQILIDYVVHKDMEGIVGGVALFDKQNTYICGLNTKLDKFELPSKAGKYQLAINFSGIHLLPGTYYIDVGFFENSAVVRLDYKSRTNYFRISSNRYFAEGLICFKHEWQVKT